MAKHIAKLTLDLKSFAPPSDAVRKAAMMQGVPTPDAGHCHASRVVEFLGQGSSVNAAMGVALRAMTEFATGANLAVVPEEEPDISRIERSLRDVKNTHEQ